MGASGWIRFVPHDPDPTVALRAARHATFADGDFYAPPQRSELELHRLRKELRAEIDELRKGPADIGDGPDRDTMIEITEGELEQIEEELVSLKSGATEPIDARIRSLLIRCAEEGTHSVLDFHRIGDTPGYGVAASLTDDDLTHLFGTTQPTRAQVTEKQDALIQHRRRGMASYVVVYDGDQPSEIAFAGISGD